MAWALSLAAQFSTAAAQSARTSPQFAFAAAINPAMAAPTVATTTAAAAAAVLADSKTATKQRMVAAI